ncbi:alpha/beta hydrolase [Lusitaniella coriacea]|uniref:alpha/beta hydrolase n=1 Tax=Lusitaniella coriacea TaxID=1983105 RepID=UPI003CF4C7EC
MQLKLTQPDNQGLQLQSDSPTQSRSLTRYRPFLSNPIFRSLFPLSLVASCIFARPSMAAERLTLRLGPLEQTVEVNDLEHFAKTGEIRPSLRFYRPLLTPQVQQHLAQRLEVDPEFADNFLQELISRPDGERLMSQLNRAIPGSSIEQVRAAIYLALHQANGLSVLSFLRAYPQETITIDATAALGIIAQLNLSNLQSQLLGPVLERELRVDSSPSLDAPSQIDPRVSGTQRVRTRERVLYDRDRKREITIDLFYGKETRGPLVVLSHGFAADRTFLHYLAQHLASHGISVVTLEHPGSNVDSITQTIDGISLNVSPNDWIDAAEFIERPKDISFVLDELAQENEAGGYLEGKFNTQQVSVIGHSLGGYTALAIAGGELNLKQLREFCHNLTPLGRSPADWLQCAAAQLPESTVQLRDERVVQAIAFNPAIGQLFGNKGLAQIEIPTLILSSSEDSVTPSLDHQLRPFKQLRGEKYLISVVGATHMSVTDIHNFESAIGKSPLVKEVMGEDAEPVRQLARGVSLAFINQLTPQADLYKPFLTSHYVQSLSTASFSMRFTTQLPSTMDAWLQVLHVGYRQIAYHSPQELRDSPGIRFATRADRAVFGTNTANHCLFHAGRTIPILRPCKGQLHHIFTSLLSNYPA